MQLALFLTLVTYQFHKKYSQHKKLCF